MNGCTEQGWALLVGNSGPPKRFTAMNFGSVVSIESVSFAGLLELLKVSMSYENWKVTKPNYDLIRRTEKSVDSLTI